MGIPSGQEPRLSILSLQPFYGGSHRAFIDGWIGASQHRWTQWTLPDRFWKWRMHHAAIEFCSRWTREELETEIDLVLCTDMLDLATFRGLLPAPHSNVPVVVYFHENQAAYPNRRADHRDLHYAFVNLTSALSADEVWFNSAFNRDSFFMELENCLETWPDFQPKDELARLPANTSVQYPGIEIREPDWANVNRPEALHIVWAARWEHDKNPRLLLEILTKLQSKNVPFLLSVLGQSFREIPEPFRIIQSQFEQQILHWGFLESREKYWETLVSGDVILSTADHEFFGLSVVEGASVGLTPLVPKRLAYPEVLERLGCGFLYEGVDEAVGRLEAWSQCLDELRRPGIRAELSGRAQQEFGWPARAKAMDEALVAVVSCPSQRGGFQE